MGKQAQKAIRLTLSSNGGVASLDVTGPDGGFASMDVDFNTALGLMEELGLLELAEHVGGAESWDLDLVSKPEGHERQDEGGAESWDQDRISKPKSNERRDEGGTRMLNIRQVAERTSMSVRTLNRMEEGDPDFPSPRWLSKGRKAWVEQEIELWIAGAQMKPKRRLVR